MILSVSSYWLQSALMISVVIVLYWIIFSYAVSYWTYTILSHMIKDHITWFDFFRNFSSILKIDFSQLQLAYIVNTTKKMETWFISSNLDKVVWSCSHLNDIWLIDGENLWTKNIISKKRLSNIVWSNHLVNEI